MHPNTKKIMMLLLVTVVLIAGFILIQLNFNALNYLLPTRIRKVIAIILVGAAIGVSSLIFQTITENNLLTPSVIGLDAVYLFLQTLIIFVFGQMGDQIFNVYTNFALSVFCMIVFTLVLFRIVFKKTTSVYFVLLFGLVMGTFFQSLASFMNMVMNPDDFLMVQDKLFASFNTVNEKLLLISAVIIVLSLIYIYRNNYRLDVMRLGKDHAINLGVDVNQLTKIMLLIVSILVSVSTALVGPITFLGIIVCNIAYQYLNTYKHRPLVITTILISIITLLIGQMANQYLFEGSSEITIMINLFGGIYFIYLLFKEGAHD